MAAEARAKVPASTQTTQSDGRTKRQTDEHTYCANVTGQPGLASFVAVSKSYHDVRSAHGKDTATTIYRFYVPGPMLCLFSSFMSNLAGCSGKSLMSLKFMGVGQTSQPKIVSLATSHTHIFPGSFCAHHATCLLRTR